MATNGNSGSGMKYTNPSFQDTSDYDDIRDVPDRNYTSLSGHGEDNNPPATAGTRTVVNKPATTAGTRTVLAIIVGILSCILAGGGGYLIYRVLHDTNRISELRLELAAANRRCDQHTTNTSNYQPTNRPTVCPTPAGNVLTDCSDTEGDSGLYVITLPGSPQTNVSVYCDMEDDPGWTVLMRRQDGSVDFGRNWEAYKYGFGSLVGEFWTGNEIIHRLTYRRPRIYELRIDLVDYDDISYHAIYNHIEVDTESAKYKLHLTGYIPGRSNINDSMGGHNNLKFSTVDQDNDVHETSCSTLFSSAGWWFGTCHSALLTGGYGANLGYAEGITWNFPWGYYKFAKFTSMKIRPQT